MIALIILLAAVLVSACGGSSPEALISSANIFLSKNDAKSASIQIKNVLQVKPDSPEARYLYGVILLNGGDAVASEVELRKALVLNYSSDLIIPKIAASLLAQGQYKKLIDEFSQSKLTTPIAKADLYTSIFVAHTGLGNVALAETALQTALTVDQAYVPAQIARVRQKASSGAFDDALADVEVMLLKSPSEVEAWQLKGDIFIFGKRSIAEGLHAYRRAVEIKKDFLPAHFAILSLLLQQSDRAESEKQIEQLRKISPNHPQALYLEAQLAFLKKDAKRARALLQKILKSASGNPLIYQLAGAVELQDNSLNQAEVYLARAVQMAPRLLPARRFLVTTYLQLGQPDKALVVLQAAAIKGELPPELNSVAGEVYLQIGDVKSAETYFEKASQQDPRDPRKRTALALAQLMKGDVATGFDALEAIAASDDGVTADLALITSHLGRREFDKALLAVDKFEKKQPNNPLGEDLRGRTQLALKDVAAARKSFENALLIEPSYFPAVASLARLDVDAKKHEVAKSRLEKFLAGNPKDVRGLLALASLSISAGAPVEETTALVRKAITANATHPAPRIVLVDLLLRAKDFKQASSAAQNAVATIPDNPDLLDALGRAQQASGDLNQAIATFNKLAVLRPNSPQPYMRLAEANMAAKNPSAAEQNLRKSLEIKPDLLEAQRRLAMLDYAAKRFGEASAIAQQVQKQRPREAAGFLIDGDINAAQRKWAPAAAAYRAGLSRESSAEATMKLITVLGSLGKAAEAAEAEKLGTNWVKEHPSDMSFMQFLADDALGRKDYAAAEKNYSAVIKALPNAAAYNNLAWVTARLKKSGALAFAAKANELAPNQPAFIDTLATLLADNQKYDEAIELHRKASALEPSNAFLKLNLAATYIKAGDKKSAKIELDSLAELGKSFPAQAEVTALQKTL